MTAGRLSALVLATDGSEDARLARRAVADLALAEGAVVHVVSAWNLAVSTYAPGYVVTAGTVDQLEEDARATVEADRRALLDAGVRAVHGHVLFGRPADVILDVARVTGAGLTVLGSRGLGPVARVILGSVSERMVGAARTPVLVMRGGDAAWPPRRIVAGVDGSRESLAAARIAAAIGRATGCGTVVLDVVRGGAEGGGHGSGHTLAGAVDDRRRRMERRAWSLARAGGPPVTGSVTTGDPAAALLAAAGDGPSGLVAVGRRGIGRIPHAVVGSVSSRVLHAAHGPVLVAPWRPVAR